MSKQKYQVGQRVKVVASTYYPTDNTRVMVGKIYELIDYDADDNTYKINRDWFNESDLEAVEKTWSNLQPGDIVIDGKGKERVVLEVLTQTFIPSVGDFSAGYVYTFAEAQADGWKIKGATPKTTLTKQQIATKFNIPVEELEIEG